MPSTSCVERAGRSSEQRSGPFCATISNVTVMRVGVAHAGGSLALPGVARSRRWSQPLAMSRMVPWDKHEQSLRGQCCGTSSQRAVWLDILLSSRATVAPVWLPSRSVQLFFCVRRVRCVCVCVCARLCVRVVLSWSSFVMVTCISSAWLRATASF